MMELTINSNVYKFKFGIGFMREMNKEHKHTENGITKEIGLQLGIADIIDGDIEGLIKVLDIANKTEEPRVTRKQLEAYIEDEETDIDELFKTVLDFLSKANVTKKLTMNILEMVEAEKEKAKQNQN